MKNTYLFLFFLISKSIFGQANNSKWSIQMNHGVNITKTLGNGSSLNAGLNYRHNDIISVQFNGGLDLFENNRITKLNISAATNLNQKSSSNPNFKLFVYGGLGLVQNLNVKMSDQKLIRGDEMAGLIFGIKPQYIVSEGFGVLIDISTQNLFWSNTELSLLWNNTCGVFFEF